MKVRSLDSHSIRYIVAASWASAAARSSACHVVRSCAGIRIPVQIYHAVSGGGGKPLHGWGKDLASASAVASESSASGEQTWKRDHEYDDGDRNCSAGA